MHQLSLTNVIVREVRIKQSRPHQAHAKIVLDDVLIHRNGPPSTRLVNILCSIFTEKREQAIIASLDGVRWIPTQDIGVLYDRL